MLQVDVFEIACRGLSEGDPRIELLQVCIDLYQRTWQAFLAMERYPGAELAVERNQGLMRKLLDANPELRVITDKYAGLLNEAAYENES
jgi:hypothetical protein